MAFHWHRVIGANGPKAAGGERCANGKPRPRERDTDNGGNDANEFQSTWIIHKTNTMGLTQMDVGPGMTPVRTGPLQ